MTEATKPKTKMYQCTHIRRQINQEMELKFPISATASDSEKTAILSRRIAEGNKIAKSRYREQLGMTHNGAATYCRNVNLFLSGKDPYASNKKANKKRAIAVETATQIPELRGIATTLGELYHKQDLDVTPRWWVVDENKPTDKTLISAHPSRDTARQVSKVMVGTKVYDSTVIKVA